MGLFRAFGSFGQRIWSAIRSSARPLAEALGLARAAEVEVEPYALIREYRHSVRLAGLQEQVASIGLSEYVPRNLYVEAELPWKHRFAYQVSMSGRDLATGRFARTERWLTFSREMEIGEIMEEASVRFSAEGLYPQIAVTHMNVIGAEIRPGEW